MTNCPTFFYAHFQLYKIQSHDGWTENTGAPVFSKSGTEMLMIKPVQDSLFGYFPQLVHLDLNSEFEPAPVTHGTFHVTDILGWDEEKNFV